VKREIYAQCKAASVPYEGNVESLKRFAESSSSWQELSSTIKEITTKSSAAQPCTNLNNMLTEVGSLLETQRRTTTLPEPTLEPYIDGYWIKTTAEGLGPCMIEKGFSGRLFRPKQTKRPGIHTLNECARECTVEENCDTFWVDVERKTCTTLNEKVGNQKKLAVKASQFNKRCYSKVMEKGMTATIIKSHLRTIQWKEEEHRQQEERQLSRQKLNQQIPVPDGSSGPRQVKRAQGRVKQLVAQEPGATALKRLDKWRD